MRCKHHITVVGRRFLKSTHCKDINFIKCFNKTTMTKHIRLYSGSSYKTPDIDDMQVTGPLSRRLVYLLKSMSYSQTVNADHTEAVIHTPGLSHESFDRDGNPSMPALMRFVTSARMYSSHKKLDDTGKTMFDWAEVTSDRLTFVASSQITTEKDLYDIQVPKCPLDVKYQLGYIGKSSVSTVASIIVPSTGQTILRNINQLVSIDKKSRRPSPLPDWWRQKHRQTAIFEEPLVVPKMELSVKPFPYKVNIAWSHTDGYNHTNYTSYVYYCINALHFALETGTIKNIDKDIIKNGMKMMRNKYIGESLENDELMVHVWCSSTEQNTVHFDIQKWGNSIFQSTFVYHD